MEIALLVLIFVVSLGVLLISSGKFVDSAESIGLSLGISTFIIGVTIVAFGTSLPELATSIVSVYAGSSEIVVGNVVGSNITNILLVLGLTAYFGRGIKLDFDVIDVDMPLLFGSAFLLFFVLRDLQVDKYEILIFLAGLVIFLMNSFKGEKSDKDSRPKVGIKEYSILLVSGMFVYLGADYTIDAISKLAAIADIDPHIIALTVVALGTSLPELIVSIAAVKKGKHAMAVGNVLGSNIFNTYAVMGISGLFGDLVIPASVMEFEILLMLAATVLFGLVCIGGKINRYEGAMLCLLYAYFITESVKGVL